MIVPQPVPGFEMTADPVARQVVVRIDEKDLQAQSLPPSEIVQRIINENQVPTTMRLWAMEQRARNNRRRFGP